MPFSESCAKGAANQTPVAAHLRHHPVTLIIIIVVIIIIIISSNITIMIDTDFLDIFRCQGFQACAGRCGPLLLRFLQVAPERDPVLLDACRILWISAPESSVASACGTDSLQCATSWEELQRLQLENSILRERNQCQQFEIGRLRARGSCICAKAITCEVQGASRLWLRS